MTALRVWWLRLVAATWELVAIAVGWMGSAGTWARTRRNRAHDRATCAALYARNVTCVNPACRRKGQRAEDFFPTQAAMFACLECEQPLWTRQGERVR